MKEKELSKTNKLNLFGFGIFSPLFVSLIVAFVVLIGSIAFFLIDPAPTGFVKTLVPPMGDEELYLTIFNNTSLARRIVNPILTTIFGYQSADALIAIWSATLSGILALAVFLLIHSIFLSDKKSRFSLAKINVISGFSALFFIAFFDEFRKTAGTLITFIRSSKLETILSGGYSAYLENTFLLIRNFLESILLGKSSSLIGRFPHPGPYIALFIFGLIAVERLKNKNKEAPWISIALIIGLIPLIKYPWIGLPFFCYLCITIVFSFIENKNFSPILVAATIIMALAFATEFLAISVDSPDFLMRVDVVYRRLPKPGYIEANLLILISSILLLKNPLGKMVLKIQMATLLAISSSLFTGYYVQPSHFSYVSAISLFLLSVSLFTLFATKIVNLKSFSALPSKNISRSTLLIGAFVLLISYIFWETASSKTSPNITLFPTEYAELIEDLQTECAEEITFYFAKDPALWYSVPARTNCKNTIPMSLNRQLSNQDIADTYVAVLKHYGQINTQSDLRNWLELRLQYIDTGFRHKTKDMSLFSAQEREFSQSFFYPYHYASIRDEQVEYFFELFENVDFSKLTNIWYREFSNFRTIELPY